MVKCKRLYLQHNVQIDCLQTKSGNEGDHQQVLRSFMSNVQFCVLINMWIDTLYVFTYPWCVRVLLSVCVHVPVRVCAHVRPCVWACVCTCVCSCVCTSVCSYMLTTEWDEYIYGFTNLHNEGVL